MIEIEVSGLAELTRKLETIPDDIQNKIMKGAMRAGANVIADEASALAPWEHLKDVEVTVKSEGGETSAKVGSGRKNHDAHFAEFGTKAHTITVKNKKVLGYRGMEQDVIFGKTMQHPGVGALPYMRPAFDTQGEAAIQAVRDFMAAVLGDLAR